MRNSAAATSWTGRSGSNAMSRPAATGDGALDAEGEHHSPIQTGSGG